MTQRFPLLRVLLLTGCVPTVLAAQSWEPRISATASSITTVTMDSSGRTIADGFSAGVDGALRRGRLTLLAGYAEGPVGPRSRRMVYGEGWAGAQYQVVPAFALRAGPVARVLVADSLTLRWVHWRLAGRFTAPLSVDDLFAYGETWAATGARSGIPDRRSMATGGTVGLGWRIARGVLRLEYAVDEARVGGADRLTIERLSVTFDLERR